MAREEKNPPVSRHSEEGIMGAHPYMCGDSISQQRANFNTLGAFDVNLLKNVKGSGGQYTALCPAHDDRANSLSVKVTGDRVLLHCHAGCSVDAILNSLGLPISSLFPGEERREKRPKPKVKPVPSNKVTYRYLNPDGSLAYRKTRYEYDNGTKSFSFFAPDGTKGITGLDRVPYNLPAVLDSDTVFFVEGEKAADAVIREGYVATSLDAGANSRWRPEYNAFFAGKDVVILPDNDTPGLKYAKAIAAQLPSSVIKILPDLPEKGDVYDWLAMGRTMAEIDTLPVEPHSQRVHDKVKDEVLAGVWGQRPQGLIGSDSVAFLPNAPGFITIDPFERSLMRGRYRWDDIGVSNLFADCHRDVSRYVPEANSWYVYNGRVWKQDVGGVVVADQAKRFMYHLLITCQKFISDDDMRGDWVEFVTKRMKKQIRDNMIADAASVWPVSIIDFDRDPFVFNCQNCTLDLRTFKARKHSPGDFLAKISGVEYDEGAVCARWDDFVGEIMCGNIETAVFLQKALGYSLTGDTSEECFFILYGNTTRNGKGTTMETMLRLIGNYGRTAQPETVAQRQNTHSGGPTEDIARLKGARFVNMSEPDKGLLLNAALVKQVTGGDTVTARFLHQNSFEYRPEYKLFINTNYLPRVSDDTVFASGRVKLIPFKRHFKESEQDKGLKAFFKRPENLSGIFNWLLEGLRLMQVEGLRQPEAVINATAQYREESDIIGQFIKESMILCENNKLKTKDAYSAYERFCDGCGYRPLNIKNFIGEFRKRGLVRDKRDKTLGTIIENYILVEEVPEGFRF